MNRYNTHREMIAMVAKALGEELLSQVAFVGGCTTGLLITDEMTKEAILVFKTDFIRLPKFLEERAPESTLLDSF